MLPPIALGGLRPNDDSPSMPQQIAIRRPSELSEDDRAAWTRLQAEDRTFESPYFHPGWTDAIARVRDDVLVAVIRDPSVTQDGPAGFWPFQKIGSRAVPVGAPLNDYQGCIAAPGLVVDTGRLLRVAGVGTWTFDHLLASQPGMEEHEDIAECSPYMELSGGFDGYLDTLSKSGRRNVKAIARRRAAMQKAEGPVRFVADVAADAGRGKSEAMLDTLIGWKSAQYRETGLPDIFEADWTRTLLIDLMAAPPEARFRGVLAALMLGDQPIAAHFGLRCGPVMHWWFPAYDDAVADHSPGWQLLLQMAETAAAEGIDRIDLGKGMSQFKRKAMSGSIPLREGVIDGSLVRRCVRRSGLVLKATLKRTPLRDYLRRPASWLFHRNIEGVLKG